MQILLDTVLIEGESHGPFGLVIREFALYEQRACAREASPLTNTYM